MSQPRDDSDGKMEVLGRFLEDLPHADPESLVREYAAAHPQWAKDFLEEAVLDRLLATSRADDALPDLSRLDDFRIRRVVAVGGMGVVYEAEQLSLGRRVALKVRSGQPSPEREAAFEREQQVLARLHQSHIVPIYQSGRCGRWQYFAMAYIEGATLHQLLRAAWQQAAAGRHVADLRQLVTEAMGRDRQLDDTARLAEYAGTLTHHAVRPGTLDSAGSVSPPGLPLNPIRLPVSYYRSVAGVIADAAEAISHAHAANVIHRDLKPSNIMVDAAGQCWLIDFGLAHLSEQHSDGQPHGPAGTPGYISPEQLRPDASTGRPAPPGVLSDVWSLGVTLFEAITLRHPFAGTTPGDETSPIRSLVPNVPADLAAICRKALQQDPGKRYPSAKELASDLRRWLEDRPTAARPVSPPRAAALWARRNKGWAAALGCAALLLISTAVFLVVRAGDRATQAELLSRANEERANEEREKARLHERETWLQDVQRMQLAEANNGWSSEAWGLVGRANGVRSDGRVRDLAVGTLRGLDARLVKQFPFGSSSVAFGPDHQSLVIGGLADPTGKPLRPAAFWRGTDPPADSLLPGEGPVACDPRGRPVQLARENGELVLWSMTEKRAAWRVPLPNGKGAKGQLALALSADANWIAASSETGEGKPRTLLWKTTSGVPWMECDFASEAVAFSESGDLVALADNTHRRIAVYSLATKELVWEFQAGALPVHSLAFGKNPKRAASLLSRSVLAVGDAGGTVGIWDLCRRMPVSYCRGLPREVVSLSFHPDGTLLATGGREEVRIWEVASGKPRLRIPGIDYVTQVAFSPDGRRLAVSNRAIYSPPDTTLWDVSNGRGLHRLTGLTGQIEAVVVSPDGKSVAALAQNWELGVWDIESGHLRYVLDVPPGSFADNAGLAFSPDGRSLAYSVGTAQRGKALLIDAASGSELRGWELPPGLQNHFGFAGPGLLWHFQVEIESGRALPVRHLDWEQHPRVGRIRNLLGGDPTRVVGEVTDFPRGVLRARMTPDGSHTVIEGAGAGRAVKVVENVTGRVVASHPSASETKGSDLVVDAAGKWAWFYDPGNRRTTQFAIPRGPVIHAPEQQLHAANAGSGYSCQLANSPPVGCLLFRIGGVSPLVNLSSGVPVNAAAFDRQGRRLVWGGRDGSVVVCDLEVVRERLKPLGLAW